MFRRVIAPALLAAGICAGTTVAGTVAALTDRHAIEMLAQGKSALMVPSYGGLGWVAPPAVFLAVRWCALRGGSRRECWAVGLAPLVLAGIAYAVIVAEIGPSALLAVAGITSGVLQGRLTIGAAVGIRMYSSSLLGLAGTCIAATWLCLFMMSERGRGQMCSSDAPKAAVV